MTVLVSTPEPPPITPSPAPVEPVGLYEVVGTRVVEKSPMGAFEVGLASYLMARLVEFAEAHGLGQVFSEMLFDLRPAVDRDRRPDLAFVSAAKWPVHRRPPRSASWTIIPDLAVEVVRPTNSATEVVDKVRESLQAGVPVVWVVYPTAREVYVYDARTPALVRRVTMGEVLEGDPVLPGFRLDLTSLFAPEEPPAPNP